MRTFTLSIAEGIRQKPKNTTYSTQAEISSLDDLKKAALFDHIAGLFKNNKRSDDNFISADCVFMDIDNDNTDNPQEWVTPAILAERLKDVEFAVVFSRNHMVDKEKRDKNTGKPRIFTARTRFHAYFPLSETVSNAITIAQIKAKMRVVVPEFDNSAKDTARFLYGVESPQTEFHEGSLFIDEFLTIEGIELPEKDNATKKKNTPIVDTSEADSKHDTQEADDSIPVGERHGTLLATALDALKNYGESKAREIFDKACARCKPQKPIEETSRIWKWAVEHVKAFKDSVRERQKKVLTLRVIEQALRDMNISIRFNVITKAIEVSDLPKDNENAPEAYYTLDDTTRKKANAEILPAFLTSYFKGKNYGVSDRFISDSIAAMASIHPLNPVLDMLHATTWDGHDRIADLYPVLGIHEDIHRSFLRKWLHQAVSLALNDAADLNSDFVLVLQGAQGIGKTNFFRALAMIPEWFQDGAVIDMRNKDSIIQATGVWICELGELDSTLKKEQSALKAFITTTFDNYRKPYARKAEKTERRTCFCATVNPAETLRDDTGSRRFAVIHVERIDKHFVYNIMTPDWCAQLWKQVYEWLYLRNGRKGFYLSDEERAFIEASNTAFTVMLDGESELLDSLAWETDIDTWKWTTIKELETRCLYLKEKRINAKKIGRALTKILNNIAASRGTTIKEYSKRVHGRTQYWIPSVDR